MAIMQGMSREKLYPSDQQIRNLKPRQSLRALTVRIPTIAQAIRRLSLIPSSVDPSDVALQDLIDAQMFEAKAEIGSNNRKKESVYKLSAEDN